MEIAVLAVILLAVFLAPLFAGRWRTSHRARFLWVSSAPQFVFPITMLIIGVWLLPRSTTLGLALTVIGLAYGLTIVRVLRRATRTAELEAPGTFERRSADTMAELVVTRVILTVMLLIVAGVVAIIWALIQRGQ